MNTKNINSIKGQVGLIAIIVAAVLIIGGGAYFAFQKSPAQKTAEVETAVGNIGVSVPTLNFSASPVPDLNVSALNVGVPQLQFGGTFSAPAVNTDFSFTPNLDITVPSMSSLNVNLPTMPTNIPANIPKNIPSNIPSNIPTNIPSASQTSAPTGSGTAGGPPANIPSTSSPAGQAGQAPAGAPSGAPADAGASGGCSQFESVPSCSYIGDPNGQAMCKQCFPNK